MRTILSENEADGLLSPFYPLIIETIESGMEDYFTYLTLSKESLSIKHFYEPATKSILIWNFIINHAKVKFNTNQHVRPIIYKRIFGLLIYDNLFIRFKKINKRGNSFSIETKNSELFNKQGVLTNFPETPTILKVGWIMSPTYSKLNDIFIVCPSNSKKINWKIDVYNKIGKQQYLFQPTEKEVTPEISDLLKINKELNQKLNDGNA